MPPARSEEVRGEVRSDSPRDIRSDIRSDLPSEVRSDVRNAAQGEGRSAAQREAPGVTPTDAHGEPPAVGWTDPTRAVKRPPGTAPRSNTPTQAPRERRPAGTLSIRPAAVADPRPPAGSVPGSGTRPASDARPSPSRFGSQPRSVRHHEPARAPRGEPADRQPRTEAFDTSVLHYFAACPRGLEAALAAELRALGAQVDASPAGGALFRGDHALGYAVNLHSRIASRVLLRVSTARYRGDDDLYRMAHRVAWERWFGTEHTLRIDVNAIRAPVHSLNFITLRIKDGVVDRFRDRTGVRPSIDTANPRVRLFGFLEEDNATLYLDLSGEPLFKRGWRSQRDDKGEAPLKENLAAGLLTLAGWTPSQSLYDPFCGSGTIAIEAAQQACGIAPGARRHFAFEHFDDFDTDTWARLREEAAEAERQGIAALEHRPVRIAASDIDPRAVEQLQRNAERAGIPAGLISAACLDIRTALPPFETPGMIVSNPPYGERIELRGERIELRGERIESHEEDVDARGAHNESGGARTMDDTGPQDAWPEIGRHLKEVFPGWKVWLLGSDPLLPRRLVLKERRKTPLFNGAIECRLFGFELFARRPDAPG